MKIHYPGCEPAGAQKNGKPWPVLRLDQLEAIYRIKREIKTGSKGVLVGAGMGSGKTVVTVEVMMQAKPKRALIVGVKDAYGQWKKAFKEQGATQPLLRINGTQEGRDNLAKLLDGDDGLFYAGLEALRAPDWEMVSETVEWSKAEQREHGLGESFQTPAKAKQKGVYRKMRPVDLLISDEAHKHANQKSASIKTMNSISAKSKIALSGTFFGNKFENAWALTTWLWGKNVIGTKGMFEAVYCVKVPVMSKDGYKQLTTPNGHPLSKVLGEARPGEFVETLPCYVFIATPIGDVPEPEAVKVVLSKEQQRQYNEMEAQSLTWIPSSVGTMREPLIADIPIVQRIRLRTAALGAMTLIPGAKEDSPDSVTFDPGCKSSLLDAAYDVLHRPSWKGKKVLILTHSKPFAVEVARRIGQKYNTALKTGDVSSKQWDKDKESFMRPVSETDSVQYLVAVISAVGTATDGLQQSCAKVLWLSEDENNVNNIQGSNRVWRDGVALEEYEAVKLITKSTIAEGVLSKNRAHRGKLLDSVAGTR